MHAQTNQLQSVVDTSIKSSIFKCDLCFTGLKLHFVISVMYTNIDIVIVRNNK